MYGARRTVALGNISTLFVKNVEQQRALFPSSLYKFILKIALFIYIETKEQKHCTFSCTRMKFHLIKAKGEGVTASRNLTIWHSKNQDDEKIDIILIWEKYFFMELRPSRKHLR